MFCDLFQHKKSRPWLFATGGKGIHFTPDYLWVDSVME